MDALTRARAALAAQAARTAAHLVKQRARHYACRPAAMDLVVLGLSRARPEVLVAVASGLIDTGRGALAPGGARSATQMLNARAILVLGRTWRRRGRGIAEPRPDR